MTLMVIRQTALFAAWLRQLRDMEARARIQMRLDRIGRGLFGDVKPVGGGVSELIGEVVANSAAARAGPNSPASTWAAIDEGVFPWAAAERIRMDAG